MAFDIFISYAHEDEPYLKALLAHLANLRNQGLIHPWSDRNIAPGTEWEPQIMKQLATAQIILLLISADFMNSDFCYSVELKQAIARHDAGQARVLPILLRPTDWGGAPFAKLQILPTSAKPISTWKNRDEAYIDVIQGIREAIQNLSNTVQNLNNAVQALSNTPPFESKSKEENRGFSMQQSHVDVLLVTVTEIEARTILQHFPDATIVHKKNQTYYNLGEIEQATIFMVQSEMGAGGPSGSILTIQESIQELQPSSIIMVGIGFGTNEEKQQIGDILVSKQLVGYDLQKVSTSANKRQRVMPRGDRPSASPRILNRFRAAANRWSVPPKIQFGLLLSGSVLIDNKQFRDQLLQLEPEAIGGEMEGAGLYDVALRAKIDWIVVKSICDWADGNKQQDKEQRQKLAAENAVRFTKYVLEQGGFAENDGGKTPFSNPQPAY